MTNLVLGGHSFIQQLGNEPAPTSVEAEKIVAACLDNGIVWFDTTYAPERLALGAALKSLNRRQDAKIIAWNFFEHFGSEGSPGSHSPYEGDSLDRMLDELQTDVVDLLVVHPVSNSAEQERQQELAHRWLDEKRVLKLGTWEPSFSAPAEPYEAAFAPYNLTTGDAPEAFANYKSKGWETFATSPFVRGWELDRQIEATKRSREEVADHMLRYAAFAANIDHLIVSMRRVEWVLANVASYKRGPLD